MECVAATYLSSLKSKVELTTVTGQSAWTLPCILLCSVIIHMSLICLLPEESFSAYTSYFKEKLKLGDLNTNTGKSAYKCICPYCLPSCAGKKKSPFPHLEIVLPHMLQVLLPISGIPALCSRADRRMSSLMKPLMLPAFSICTWLVPPPHGLPWWLRGKESACNAGDTGSIPGLGRSCGGRNGNPLWHSILENSMDRGAWRATVHVVAKSWTQLSN